MISYSGRYRVEDGKVITKVEVAWNEAWVGGEQVRFLRFEGDDLLFIESPPMPHPNVDDKVVRVIVTGRATSRRCARLSRLILSKHARPPLRECRRPARAISENGACSGDEIRSHKGRDSRARRSTIPGALLDLP